MAYDTRPNGERARQLAEVPASLVPLGYQRLAVSTVAASGLTPPAGARLAALQAESANIRFRDAGGAPTAASGMRLLSNGSIYDYDSNLSAIQFIAEGAGAFLNVSYYG
ncbi:hypothetical protein [Luteibacter pinisoli]|uniref:hypothetical protein n=1 Tax=Luteibacter pinisoli TaxID=2589080 RepID=UPI001476F092|nr:hypothetical protein [Luteibacter pinisoli]